MWHSCRGDPVFTEGTYLTHAIGWKAGNGGGKVLFDTHQVLLIRKEILNQISHLILSWQTSLTFVEPSFLKPFYLLSSFEG